MKKLLKALLLVLTVTLFATAFAASASAAEYDPEQLLVYEGLQARTLNDNPGLRSLYKVDDELIAELVAAGHEVQYGAMMGIGRIGETDYLTLANMTVVRDAENKTITAPATTFTVGGKNVKVAPSLVVVYDSTGDYGATELYATRGEVKSTFAYTTRFGHSSENVTMLKDVEMVYRAFIIIDDVVTYVNAEGQTFGSDTATYERATSLYEVCDYFSTKYETASGAKPYASSVAIRRVISSCMEDSFKVEYADGASLTTNVSGCTVTVPAIKAGIYAVKMNYVHPTANSGYRFTVKNTTTGEIAHAKMPINTSGDGTTPAWSVDFMYMYLAEGENVLQIAADSAITKLYGVELTQKVNTPVEDTYAAHVTPSNTEFWYNGANVGTSYKDPNDTSNSAQKTNVFNKHSAGAMYFVRTGATAKHTISVNATATYDLYIVGSATGTTVTATVGTQTKKVSVPATYVSGAGTQSITSEGSGTNLIKIGSFALDKGENTVEITNGFYLTFGSIIAVRQATTVTLYNSDGTTPISVQKVYDLEDVVLPTNVKIPAGYDDVSGWSDLTYDEATGGYTSTIAYGKYYNVDFYDYDRTTLLASMRVVAGSDNAGPDMSGVKDFKGWSTPLSEVNSDCSVYAVKKQTSASVSASDVILASASYNKVASDATYSDYEGYYTVVATEADGFVAGAVYTAIEGGYELALAETDGATYYTLSVVPEKVIAKIYTKSDSDYIAVTEDTYDASATNYCISAASKTTYSSDYSYKMAEDGSYIKLSAAEDGVTKYYKLTATTVQTANTAWFDPSENDYYTYTYTLSDESPVKILGSDNFYTPATATTTDAIYFPNVSGIKPSTTYVSVFVTVDYTGYYKVDVGTSNMYSYYASIRNMTTESQNANIEAFMTNRATGNRIKGTKVTGNKANALFASASKAYTMGYLYLAEGVNEIRLYHNYHADNGTGSAFSTVDFTLLREHDVENSLEFELLAVKSGWQYSDGGNDTAYGDGTGYRRVQPQSKQNSVYVFNMPYDIIGGVTLATDTTQMISSAEIPADATPATRAVTLKAGTYSLVEYLNSSSHNIVYTFTKTDDEAVSVVATTSSSGDLLGHSFCAFKELAGPTVTIPEDGTYNVSIVATKTSNYISYAMFHLVPVEGETHTVKFYDGDGNLLSVQSVADGTAATAPDVETNNFLGWSEDFSAVTADMEVYALYDIRYTVNYYDNEVLISTESVMKDNAANAPDYTAYKDFIGWSTSPDEYIEADLSGVNEDMNVYLITKKTSVSVSASDVVLASASYNKVASDATYSNFEGYYTVVATEADGFVAGEVYTATEDGYALALTETDGATYYTLAVTPVVATSESTLTDYYTYTYTVADESPVKVTGSYADEYYTPATSTTADAIFLPAVANSNYVTLKVNADYSGSYLITFDYLLSNARAYSLGFKNVTTTAQNANIESFMTDTTTEGRINKTQSAVNKAAFLYSEPTQTTGVGYIFLAEGVNYVKIYNATNSSSSTGIAVSDFGFELAGEHVPGTVVLTPKDADDKNWWQHANYKSEAFENTFMDALSVGTLEPGTYTLYAMVIGSAGGKFEFTLNGQTQTYTLGANASYTASSVEDFENGCLTAIGGKSTGAYADVPVATFTVTEAGEYTLTGKTTWRNNYIGFYRCRLVPVESTVTFINPDDTVIAKETVITGGAATAPDMTDDEGFLYWDTDFSVITGDTTVTAVRRHTVTFRTYDGTLIEAKSTVTGGTVIAPEAPARDGYYFTGWSKDIENVRSDLSVRATYQEKEKFTVTFVDRFGETLATHEVYTGDAVTPPEYTAPDGYLFLGWSADTSAVFENMTVTARTAAINLTGENLVGTGTTAVAAVEGTSLETIFLPLGSANYITFNVTADIEGYYALNMQMNNGGAKLHYVRVKNTSATTYEQNYYGVGRVNKDSKAAAVTAENCAVAEGTAYTEDILHVYLHAGENTLRLFFDGDIGSAGISGITLTLKSGDKLADGDYIAAYDKNSWISDESDTSKSGDLTSGNDGYSGGALLRVNRYVTLSETVTFSEDGYYHMHGIMAEAGSVVTLTDVSDPENVIVFNAEDLGNKGGTASSPFWHGTRDKANIFAGTYKVKVYSNGNHVFTAYYFTREGELDGVYNVGTENATLGEGAERLANAASVLLPGTEAGYVELPVTADRSGLFRVELAASTQAESLNGLYATVNGGRIYTLSPACFGTASDQYLNISYNDESCLYLPLEKGENVVRFYTGNGEQMSIAGARFFYESSLADSEPYTGDTLTVAGTSGTVTAVSSGTAVKNADHVAITSTSYSNGANLVYTFSVDSARTVYFNMTMETTLGTVFLYTLTDAEGNVLRDTFYAVNHDTVGVETLNLDIFELPAAGEYTLTMQMRYSPVNNKDSVSGAIEKAEIGSEVYSNIYSLEFVRTAEDLSTPDATSGDVTSSNVTGATIIGAGARVTFNNVSLYRNANYALRILGRVSTGAVVTVSYEGAGNILESDYLYDQLFTVTTVDAIAADNTTVYEYNTRTGKYVLATEYNADTVYYLRTGTVTPSSGSVTFTAGEAVTATQWLDLANLNLLADTYTITVTVSEGSLVIDEMVLVRAADYLRVIEIDRSALSQTDANEVRIATLSDNHYIYSSNLGGYNDLERQELMIDMLLAEYNTPESLDATFLAADFTTTRMSATTTFDKGQVYSYSMAYLVENVMRRMTDTGLPYFVTHSGHDYKSSEEWYDLFGYEKNYVVVIEDAAYICLDYHYNQADTFAHESGGSQVDISDEVRDQILAVLDRDDISYASIIIHYSVDSLPNINAVSNHEKVKVAFGGHTHDNTTQVEVGKGVSQGQGGLFLQHAHFSIVSGYDTGGKTVVNPTIALTNEGYYQVFSGVTYDAAAPYKTLSEIGIEYASKLETTKLAMTDDSGNALYSTSGTWQTAAYTTDGKKIIFFRDEYLVEKKDYAQIAYNYYVIDGDNVYAADLSAAVSETYQFSYTGTEATDKSITGLVYGVDYFKVGMASGSTVIVFPDSYETQTGNYNVTTTGKTYYLVNEDGSLSLLSGVTVAPHAVAAENRVLSETHTYNGKTTMTYEVSGCPWGIRILERVNGTETDVLETYYVYGGYTYGSFYHGYMRLRPTDMAGYIDHTYILVDFLDKN